MLEVAAGPGDTGLQVAAALDGDGTVILSDRSPAMVEVARRAAAAAGLRNVEVRVLDAESMDLADAVVDRVVCRFGYMLLADPAAGLRETRRVCDRAGAWPSPCGAPPPRTSGRPRSGTCSSG